MEYPMNASKYHMLFYNRILSILYLKKANAKQ